MSNTRRPRLDKYKAPVAPEVAQEPQDMKTKTLNNKSVQEREPLPEEETERESIVEEEENEEVDYQYVAWNGTFPVASGKDTRAFVEVLPARQKENSRVFVKCSEGISVTFLGGTYGLHK